MMGQHPDAGRAPSDSARLMADEPTVDFGTYLRQAREKRGISLQQVSATTKISVRVLDALERNDPRKLPGGIFSRAFVRSYAREVGLDPEVVVSQFVSAFPDHAGGEATPAAASAVPDDPETFESRRRAATTFLQLAGISLVVIAIVVFYLNMRRNAPTPPVKVVSEATQEQRAAQAAAQAVSSPTSEPLAQQPSVQPGGQAGATGTQATPPSPAPGTVTPPATTSSAPAGAADAPLTLAITSNAACWLVLTVDGARVVARTLEPGEQVTFPVKSFVTIDAGNAGALAVTLNGKPARAIGKAGEVVKTTITPDNFRTYLQ
jgi:cytoskeleton protein RodZ